MKPRRTALNPNERMSAASASVSPPAVAGGTYGGVFHTTFTPWRITTRPTESLIQPPATCSGPDTRSAAGIGVPCGAVVVGGFAWCIELDEQAAAKTMRTSARILPRRAPTHA